MAQNPLRILVDARVLSKGRISGIEEYTRLLIEHLLDIDKKNHYVFFTNGMRKPFFPLSWENNKNVSRLGWRVPNKLFDASNIFLRQPKIDVVAHADVVFSPNVNLLSASQKSKRVITFHDLSFVHFPEFYSLRARLWHVLQRYKRSAAEADKILTISNFTARDISETLGIPKEKISVSYPGINPVYGKVTDDAKLYKFRKKHDIEQPFILFVGTLEPRKNVRSIIRSFSAVKSIGQFRDIKLVLAGRRGWRCDTIFNEAEKSGFAESIVFWGSGNSEDLVNLYSACEVFMFPSFFEGFGFPPLEAQACGAPVIASNRSSLPEVLRDSAMLVDPWDIDEQIFALGEVLKSQPLRRRLAEKGIENTKRFSWNKTAGDALKLFEQ